MRGGTISLMRTKLATSFRLDKKTVEAIEDLAKWLRLSRTGVVELAVQRLAISEARRSS